MQQLQDKMEQIKTLEETLQAEKAAHLDCKFTGEIAQVHHHTTPGFKIKNGFMAILRHLILNINMAT